MQMCPSAGRDVRFVLSFDLFFYVSFWVPVTRRKCLLYLPTHAQCPHAAPAWHTNAQYLLMNNKGPLTYHSFFPKGKAGRSCGYGLCPSCGRMERVGSWFPHRAWQWQA
uniref:Uncharacterized protein n=1 Tax=Mus musculus TaxID=10090 RepID=Q8C3G0_MOUSE|nr:unnamed protein product [Mus musculus]